MLKKSFFLNICLKSGDRIDTILIFVLYFYLILQYSNTLIHNKFSEFKFDLCFVLILHFFCNVYVFINKGTVHVILPDSLVLEGFVQFTTAPSIKNVRNIPYVLFENRDFQSALGTNYRRNL